MTKIRFVGPDVHSETVAVADAESLLSKPCEPGCEAGPTVYLLTDLFHHHIGKHYGIRRILFVRANGKSYQYRIPQRHLSV